MRGVFIVAKVAISRASYSFDALYSYSVPEELAQKVKSGVRLLVPFGRGNRKAVGFVARTYTEAEYNDKLKPTALRFPLPKGTRTRTPLFTF